MLPNKPYLLGENLLTSQDYWVTKLHFMGNLVQKTVPSTSLQVKQSEKKSGMAHRHAVFCTFAGSLHLPQSAVCLAAVCSLSAFRLPGLLNIMNETPDVAYVSVQFGFSFMLYDQCRSG